MKETVEKSLTSLIFGSLMMAASLAAQATQDRLAQWQGFTFNAESAQGHTKLFGMPLYLSIQVLGTQIASINVVMGGRRIDIPVNELPDVKDVDHSSAQVFYGTCCYGAVPDRTPEDESLYFFVRLPIRNKIAPVEHEDGSHLEFMFVRGVYDGWSMNYLLDESTRRQTSKPRGQAEAVHVIHRPHVR